MIIAGKFGGVNSTSTALYAGCIFPIGKKTQLSPYYEHQNSTGRSPNQQTDGLD